MSCPCKNSCQIVEGVLTDLSIITLALCRQNTRRLPHTLLVSDRFHSIWPHVSLMPMLGNKSATFCFNRKIYLINSMKQAFCPLLQINLHLHPAFGTLSTNKSHFLLLVCFFFSRDGGGCGSYSESEELVSRPPRWAEEGGDSAAGSWTGKGKSLYFMQQHEIFMFHFIVKVSSAVVFFPIRISQFW